MGYIGFGYNDNSRNKTINSGLHVNALKTKDLSQWDGLVRMNLQYNQTVLKMILVIIKIGIYGGY